MLFTLYVCLCIVQAAAREVGKEPSGSKEQRPLPPNSPVSVSSLLLLSVYAQHFCVFFVLFVFLYFCLFLYFGFVCLSPACSVYLRTQHFVVFWKCTWRLLHKLCEHWGVASGRSGSPATVRQEAIHKHKHKHKDKHKHKHKEAIHKHKQGQETAGEKLTDTNAVKKPPMQYVPSATSRETRMSTVQGRGYALTDMLTVRINYKQIPIKPRTGILGRLPLNLLSKKVGLKGQSPDQPFRRWEALSL